MSLIHVEAADIVEYHGRRVPAYAVAFANVQFTSSEEVVVAKGDERHPEFGQRFDVSQVSDKIRIASGDIYATTNSSDPNGATYNLVVFDVHNRPILTVFSGLRVPDELTPTSWDNLRIYSQARRLREAPTYLNSSEIMALLAGLQLAPLATDVIHGRVRLNLAADDELDPVALGANDPRLTLMHRSTNVFFLRDYDNDLPAAIADIGTSTEAILVIDEPDQYVQTGTPLTTGTLEVDETYEELDYRGYVPLDRGLSFLEKDGELDEHGNGFTMEETIAAEGGTGTGLTVTVKFVGADGVLFGHEVDSGGTGYKVDDRVTLPSNGIVIGGAGTPAINGVYSYRQTLNGKRAYNLSGHDISASLYAIFWTGTAWRITDSAGTAMYQSTDAVTYPWQVTTWTTVSGAGPVPEATSSPSAYMFVQRVIGDDFSNVGSSFFDVDPILVPGNAEGVIFTATDVGPADWGLETPLRQYLTVPGNIWIDIRESGSLRAEGEGGGIYIKSFIAPMGNRQVFTTDGSGKIILDPRGSARLNLAWWAGKATDADNTHNFKQLRDSLGKDKVGGSATIPGGKWYTDPIVWTNQSVITGVGRHLDGIGVGTCILPFTNELDYRGIFEVQQQFVNIVFEHMSLVASASGFSTADGRTMSAFRYRSAGPTSFGLTFNHVDFVNQSVEDGAFPLVSIDGTAAWWETVNIIFDGCTWTAASPHSIAFFFRASNSVVTMINPRMRAGTGGVCISAPAAGWFEIINPDWRGIPGYTLEESDHRTLPHCSIVAGTNLLMVDESYVFEAMFTRNDIGRYVVEAAALPDDGAPLLNATRSPKYFIAGLENSRIATLGGGPNGDGTAMGDLVDQEVLIQDLGLWTGPVARCCIDVGHHILVNIRGGVDEGFQNFIEDGAVRYDSQITISGASIQGRIVFDGGSSTMDLYGCWIYSNNMALTTGSPVLRMIGGVTGNTVAVYDNTRFPYPGMALTRGNAFHSPVSVDENWLFDTSHKFSYGNPSQEGERYNFLVYEPARFIHKNTFGGFGQDVPIVEIASPLATDPAEQVLLRLSQSYPTGHVPRDWYDFIRNNATGYLDILGRTENRPFMGIHHNGQMWVDQAIVLNSRQDTDYFGYASGGTVEQLTNKSTAVEINAKCGTIVVEATSSIPANSFVEFVVNNDAVTADDMPHIILSRNVGGYAFADVNRVETGLFSIRLYNPTAVAETKLYVIRFSLGMRSSPFAEDAISPPVPPPA